MVRSLRSYLGDESQPPHCGHNSDMAGQTDHKTGQVEAPSRSLSSAHSRQSSRISPADPSLKYMRATLKINLYSIEVMEVFFSRFAFIFLIFTVVSSGYITEVLSCQIRNMFESSTYFRHIVGLLMVFVFIMLEGGWSFDKKEDDKASNDWSSGNVIHSLGIAALIYGMFIISSKSQFWPNIIFFALLFILYAINTQRNYYKAREMISEEANQKTIKVEYGIAGISLITLAYGFYDYIGYQKAQRGSGFNWTDFLLGAHKCAGSTTK